MAERLALNQVGEGSSPSGPTRLGGKLVGMSCTVLHWSSSGEDTAPVMRQRGFESHPVLFICVDDGFKIGTSPARGTKIFNNSTSNSCTHDVAEAYRLAKAEVWVQLPLGAFLCALMHG